MSTEGTYAYDLFVSYAEADRPWVEGYLLDVLSQAGVRCHSEAAFALGVPRLLEFERAIRQSRRVLLVLSPAYLAEGFTQFADLLAQSYGLETATWPVIPLILHPVKLPPRLAILTALDATDPDAWPRTLERLLADLQRPFPAIPPCPPCPYPGMAPFSESDSARFFGRDVEVSIILEQLRLHSFLAVIGPSGSGKSSLVFAGLIPALRKSSLFGPGTWLVRSFRPGRAPLSALAAVLDGDPADPAHAVAQLLATQPDARRLLLVIDQFEELFTLAGPDVESFQQALRHLAETPDCFVVLTVRADFYPDLMLTSLWPEVQAHRFEVLPLSGDGLRQAIVRPAEDVGVFVETALVERLVADAGREPGVLPFVQETLLLLWERVERRFLPLRAYEALVLPRQAYGGHPLTGLQVAMARRADAALAALTPEQQLIARRIFLRLVQFGEGRADTRRQQRVSALRAEGEEAGAFEHTLEHLARSRLLTFGGEEEAGDASVDIAHEALIEGWPVLREWIDTCWATEVTRRHLEARAEQWVRRHRSSGMLDRAELSEADVWLAESASLALGIDPLLTEFLAASRAALRAQKRMQWVRPLVAVVLVSALVLGGWSGYGVWLRRQALRMSPVVNFEGGEFVIGTDDPSIHQYSRPEIRVEWPAFAIEQYEVSNRLYCWCNQAGRCGDHSYGKQSVCDRQIADEPVTRLSLSAANDYCRWLGRRLPTEIEWEHAARGVENHLYPTGNDPPIAGEVNIGDAKTASEGVWAVRDMRDDHTPEGVFGMAGNVSEWTVSLWLPYNHPAYLTTWWPAEVTDAEGYVVIRGGSWQSGVSRARVSVRYNRLANEGSQDVGLRCVVGLPLEALREEVMLVPRNP